MDSGLHWGLKEDYVDGCALARDKTAFGEALRADHAPGSWWEYNNMGLQNMEAVLRNATGVGVATFAQEHLFSKIGLGVPKMFPHGVPWYTDAAGHALLYGGLQLG